MSTITFQQTDTAALCGAQVCCAPDSLGVTNDARQMSQFGTAGSGNYTVKINADGSEYVAIMFESAAGEPGKDTWESGTWTINFNVTTANSSVTWTGCYICREQAACGSLVLIGQNQAVNKSCGTTGVKTTTVSGSAYGPNSVTDRVYVLLAFTGSGGVGTKTIAYKPDQTIVSPLVSILRPPLNFPWPRRKKKPGPRPRKKKVWLLKVPGFLFGAKLPPVGYRRPRRKPRRKRKVEPTWIFPNLQTGNLGKLPPVGYRKPRKKTRPKKKVPPTWIFPNIQVPHLPGNVFPARKRKRKKGGFKKAPRSWLQWDQGFSAPPLRQMCGQIVVLESLQATGLVEGSYLASTLAEEALRATGAALEALSANALCAEVYQARACIDACVC